MSVKNEGWKQGASTVDDREVVIRKESVSCSALCISYIPFLQITICNNIRHLAAPPLLVNRYLGSIERIRRVQPDYQRTNLPLFLFCFVLQGERTERPTEQSKI